MAKSVCLGAGLVALDVILNGSPNSPAYLNAGGSCGNVLTILAYLGWSAAPVARLGNDKAASELLKDLLLWDVSKDFITRSNDGSTPIIIHRILTDKFGNSKHKFEFKDPDLGSWLPQYKPVLASFVENLEFINRPNVYYFDRANRGTIDLAKKCKEADALVFFEPTSINDLRLFKQALEVADIMKFSGDRIKDYDELFASQQCTLEIRTLGSEGLQFRYNKSKKATKWETIKANSIDPTLIKDSAGAGDWCSAGILQKLGTNGKKSFKSSTKKDIIAALRMGQAYASINICFNGARGLMYHIDSPVFRKTAMKLLEGKTSFLKDFLDGAATTNLKAHSALKIFSLYH